MREEDSAGKLQNASLVDAFLQSQSLSDLLLGWYSYRIFWDLVFWELLNQVTARKSHYMVERLSCWEDLPVSHLQFPIPTHFCYNFL